MCFYSVFKKDSIYIRDGKKFPKYLSLKTWEVKEYHAPGYNKSALIDNAVRKNYIANSMQVLLQDWARFPRARFFV